MEIKIYGSGCKKCVKLAKNAQQAASELGVKAEIIKVEAIEEIAAAGIMSTPALAVNDQLKVKGRVASSAEIKEFLSEA